MKEYVGRTLKTMYAIATPLHSVPDIRIVGYVKVFTVANRYEREPVTVFKEIATWRQMKHATAANYKQILSAKQGPKESLRTFKLGVLVKFMISNTSPRRTSLGKHSSSRNRESTTASFERSSNMSVGSWITSLRSFARPMVSTMT